MTSHLSRDIRVITPHRISEPLNKKNMSYRTSFCCNPRTPCTASTLSSCASLSTVTFLQTRSSEQSSLLGRVEQYQRDQQQQRVLQTLSTLTANATQVNDAFQRQWVDQVQLRYQPYQPYQPPIVPVSVMELEMRTRNVGVPIPTMAIANCKGSQFVTS